MPSREPTSDQTVECPDGGTCHHGCTDKCLRVEVSGPLSGVFPNDRWPRDVRLVPMPRKITRGQLLAQANVEAEHQRERAEANYANVLAMRAQRDDALARAEAAEAALITASKDTQNAKLHLALATLHRDATLLADAAWLVLCEYGSSGVPMVERLAERTARMRDKTLRDLATAAQEHDDSVRRDGLRAGLEQALSLCKQDNDRAFKFRERAGDRVGGVLASRIDYGTDRVMAVADEIEKLIESAKGGK